MPTISHPISIGILLFSTVEELDFAGPYEVFSNAGVEHDRQYCRVMTIGTERTIRCRGGLRVLSDYLLEECPDLDLLIVPGGPGARERYDDERIAAFLRRQHKQTPTIASVCTGAFLLAFAGLLDQCRATTHSSRLELFHQRFPQIEIVQEKIVDQGNILTAGGVSSGIDLALYLLEKWFGPEARQWAAKRLDGPWS